MTRTLQERRLIETTRGRIAVGWLVVEDLILVLVLVMIPAITDLLRGASPADAISPWQRQDILTTFAFTFGQVAAFIALMLVVGRRVIPWILHYVAHTGSRELFRLSVLAIALGVAYGATELFGISFALGAFFAGMMLHESPLSQRAAEESLPLRDAFAVLFFVSVGMLFDPSILIRAPLLVVATLLVILIGNSLTAFGIMRAFGYPMRTALTVAASLAQIGEFSFILAGLGVALEILPAAGRDLILAGALISIIANPILFFGLERIMPAGDEKTEPQPTGQPQVVEEPAEIPTTKLNDHAVLIGYGRVGRVIGEELIRRKLPFLVVEEQGPIATELRGKGTEVISANGALSRVLEAANLKGARWLFVAIPDAFEAGQIVNQAREQQRGSPDHRARPFRRGGRSSNRARRHPYDHGRTRDRPRDAGLCAGTVARESRERINDGCCRGTRTDFVGPDNLTGAPSRRGFARVGYRWACGRRRPRRASKSIRCRHPVPARARRCGGWSPRSHLSRS